MGAELADQLVGGELRASRTASRAGTAVSSRCGLSEAAPKIALDTATNTRVSRPWSRTASSNAAVEPAIAVEVRAGSRHESGTNDGAARW